ncbi:beta strand repeat-containing protein [Humisphaera borealis]|nr:Calx-beta domain-containing protein [Humisphaera borealis]
MIASDGGDAPDTYGTLVVSNGPAHGIVAVRLGSAVGTDSNLQATAAANTDPDDDGVFVGTSLLQDLTLSGPTVNLTIKVANPQSATTGEFLHAWIDFDGNGTFDAAEKIIDNQDMAIGDNAVAVTIPGNAKPGTTYARFRIVQSSTPGLGPKGQTATFTNGEVEDYRLTISRAESLIVTTTADEDDGTSDPAFGAGTSLRESMTYAASTAGDDTITFSNLFDTAQTITLGSSITVSGMNGAITVNGPGAKLLTVTGGTFDLLRIIGNTAAFTLNDITLGSAGAAVANGAGIRVDNSTINFNRGVIRGRDKGLISDRAGPVTITDSALLNNAESSSGFGAGGVAALDTISLTIRNSTISGNSSSTSSLAGGVQAIRTALTIENSTIAGNSGGTGGVRSDSTTTISNTLVAGNTVTGSFSDRADFYHTSGTLVANNNLIGESGTAAVVHGVDGNIVGKDDGAGGRIDLPLSEIVDALADNGGPTPTHALIIGSPAFNKGRNSLITSGLTTDQRGTGFARIGAGTVDIGAFERNNFNDSLVVTTTADEDDGTSDPAFGAGTSLREAMTYAASTAGNDTITFSSLFDTAKTITLGSTIDLIDTTGATTVNGTGAELLTITGTPQLFAIQNGTLTLNDITLGTAGATNAEEGIRSTDATVAIHRSVITGRQTAVSGNSSDVTIADSTIAGNEALQTGGVEAFSSKLTIRNSTISGNSSTGTTYAGGVYSIRTDLLIENSTVSGNNGGVGGSYLYADEIGGSVTLRNSIFAGNTNGGGSFYTNDLNAFDGNGVNASHNLIGDPATANIVHGTNGNIVGKDDGAGGRTPLPFVEIAGALGDNGGPTPTHALVAGSPALGAGLNTLVPTGLDFDQRGTGFTRIVGTVDIGAFEAQQADVSIDDVSLTEGDSGVKVFSFNVTRTADTGTASVQWATANGTTPGAIAQAGLDYQAASGTVNFAAGQLVQAVTVNVYGDTDIESDQSFFVNLSNPTNLVITDGQGEGTIQNDDIPPPTLTIADASVTEGDSGTKNINFTVTLDRKINQPVSFKYATASGTATSGTDFVAKSGTLTIPAFGKTAVVTIQVKGDTVYEPNETFFVNLSAPTVAVIGDAQGKGTIVNNDAVPKIRINNAPTITEGNSGTKLMTFTVTLDRPSGAAVSVKFATADGTAKASLNDYIAKSGTVTFNPGETSKTITVSVVGDTKKGVTETLFVNLTSPVGAIIDDGQGVGTILNDD